VVPFCVISSIQSMSLPKMASHSFDPREALLAELRQKFPEVFTEAEIDLEKMQNFLQCKFSEDKDRYRMTWAGRKAAIQQVQVKTTNTLVPEPEQSVNFETTGNVFIEGDNLEVLRVLQKSYYGKVKVIYIDPPYNTGNDFVYHDDFKQNKGNYHQASGITDEEGNVLSEHSLVKNSKDQGHYHSNWLSMMFPRLYLAKNLLRQDGIIFISIDDNEAPRLRLLMDEVFGEENFISQFIWKSRQNVDSRSLTGASNDHEYVLCYARNQGTSLRGKEINKDKYKNPDNDPRGPWMSSAMDGIATKEKRPNLHYIITNVKTGIEYKPSAANGWRFQRSTVDKLIEENRIIWPKDQNSKPRFKRYLNELQREFTGFSSMLNADFTLVGTRELRDLMDMETVKFPKPTSLLNVLLKQVPADNDEIIILDFFAGSATTAQAVMSLNAEDGGNRKWICVQIGESCDRDSESYQAGYKTIADIARERIRRAGKKIQKAKEIKKLDIGFKSFRLAKSNFPVWQGSVQDEHDLLNQMDLFANAQQHDAKPINLLYELILKEGLAINIDIQQKKSESGTYYLINQGKLATSFVSSITDQLMDALFLEKPEKIILLESAFTGNDELKMNTVLHAQTLKIDIRVI
jgi:adenine-specific DNA-methyltransferase